jgi:hypothetical protein
MRDFLEASPLKILESSTDKELGKGNLGVLIARAGVGKTSCLIHIAFDRLFRGERIAHVSLKDTPEKVSAHYSVIFSDLVKVLNIENEAKVRAHLEKNRIILAYLRESFDLTRLSRNLVNLSVEAKFKPETLIIDGIDFTVTGRDVFQRFKRAAQEFDLEVWFSALSHRHIAEVNDRGIPFPCDKVDDLFSLILQLHAIQSGVFLTLLKDHDSDRIPDATVRLDPNSFLAVG